MANETQTTEPETLKRLNVRVTEAGQATVNRAVTLRLAMLGETQSDDPELHGAALVGIVTEWLKSKSDELREARA